jgi:hypothetical protein
MFFLNNQKKKLALNRINIKHSANYANMHRKVIREAKRRQNDRHKFNANNKRKAVW